MKLSLKSAKDSAKRLRQFMDDKGVSLSHSECLEAFSRIFGMRDWNTLSAMLTGETKQYPTLGMRVSGAFRGQKFSATVSGLELLRNTPKRCPSFYKIKLQFDEKIDVVTSDKMQGLRSYVWVYMDADGHTVDRLGRPDGSGCIKLH